MTSDTPIRKLTRFVTGRSSRREYWLSVAGLVALSLGITVLATPSIASLACLPVWIVIGSRRLHDFGQTGWWSLTGFVVGFVLGFARGVGVDISPSLELWTNGLVAIILFAIIGLIPGDRESNRFGPPPARRKHSASATVD